MCHLTPVHADRNLQRVAALLEKYRIDPRDLTLQQLNSLSEALQFLQAETPGINQTVQFTRHGEPHIVKPSPWN